jgi:hypothetical protein
MVAKLLANWLTRLGKPGVCRCCFVFKQNFVFGIREYKARIVLHFTNITVVAYSCPSNPGYAFYLCLRQVALHPVFGTLPGTIN